MNNKPKRKPKDVSSLFLAAERFESTRQLRRAFQCLSEAANLGHASSQLNLGNYFASGIGVRKNLSKAAYWYKRAYRNGNEMAARNLALDKLAVGDTRSAIRWLRKGIEMKDGSSYVVLARIYSRQRGGKGKAERLLRRVSKLSSDYACELDQEEAAALLAEIRAR